jgi:hypothetical protein
MMDPTNDHAEAEIAELKAGEETLKLAHQVEQQAELAKGKGGLIQFRIEDDTFKQLEAMAKRLSSSPGMLSRQWVVERIQWELAQSNKQALKWHGERVEAIKEEARKADSQDFQDGPFFVLHVIPLTDGVLLRPANMEKSAMSLRPLRRAGAYTGRINHLGYESRTAENVPKRAYIQVFRTGEFECLRPMWTKSETVLNGTFSDIEIVDAAFTACAFLAGQQVPLPYLVLITICGIKDMSISSSLQVPITVEDLTLPAVEIKRPDEIAKAGSIAPMALSLYESLNVWWNASGHPHSMSGFDLTAKEWAPAKHPI